MSHYKDEGVGERALMYAVGLCHNSPEVRIAACNALAKCKSTEEAENVLIYAAQLIHNPPDVRVAAINALSMSNHRSEMALAYTVSLGTENEIVRAAAANKIGEKRY